MVLKKAKIIFIALGLLLTCISLIGCSQEEKKTKLTILAAASLTEVYTELEKGFEAQYTDIDLQFTFAGTTTLLPQIKEGIEADIFVSASESAILELLDEGYIKEEAVKVFAHNQLAFMIYKDSNFDVKSMEDVLQEGIKVIIGEPNLPVGKYTVEMLDKIEAEGLYGENYKELFMDHVVSMENSVKAVAIKVEMGEADVGVVYATDFTSLNNKWVYGIDIPKAYNPKATYELATLKNSKNKRMADKFVAYVLGKEGQDYLLKYGFILPE
ncbi:MAG: molybdate ABC transporter substrate-binding protein [Firmicutes bacterium HGW-Firmicutes-1]|jgi:molybdate transport system substrate-binding protein|nr:MAG: molybdate ABC transporter substrate-binding protein [Firmicutes bacterium HGW-Firmicutes-1]